MKNNVPLVYSTVLKHCSAQVIYKPCRHRTKPNSKVTQLRYKVITRINVN